MVLLTWERRRSRTDRTFGGLGQIKCAGTDDVDSGAQDVLGSNMLARLKRPLVGEGDDWDRRLKKHRKIKKYTAAVQEKWQAFQGTDHVGPPSEARSTSEFLDSDTNSSKSVPGPKTGVAKRKIDRSIEESGRESIRSETQDPPGQTTRPQDPSLVEGPVAPPRALAEVGAGKPRRTRPPKDRTDINDENLISTGKRTTRSARAAMSFIWQGKRGA